MSDAQSLPDVAFEPKQAMWTATHLGAKFRFQTKMLPASNYGGYIFNKCTIADWVDLTAKLLFDVRRSRPADLVNRCTIIKSFASKNDPEWPLWNKTQWTCS
jgi:hypothetical protein